MRIGHGCSQLLVETRLGALANGWSLLEASAAFQVLQDAEHKRSADSAFRSCPQLYPMGAFCVAWDVNTRRTMAAYKDQTVKIFDGTTNLLAS